MTFKTPDVLDYALEDVPEDRHEYVRAKLARWVKWGEYVTVTFDLDRMTAKVEESR